MKKISFLTGILLASMAWANTPVAIASSNDETVDSYSPDADECKLKGWVQIEYRQSGSFGSITGWVGGEYVHWNVFANRVNEYLRNGLRVSLNLDRRERSSFSTLSGWVGSTHVYWNGSNDRWNQYVTCIN